VDARIARRQRGAGGGIHQQVDEETKFSTSSARNSRSSNGDSSAASKPEPKTIGSTVKPVTTEEGMSNFFLRKITDT
jgi:hypothetical protein